MEILPRHTNLLLGVFPYSQKGCPSDIICQDCGGPGWGPMLKNRVWYNIVAFIEEEDFLCEECMVKRLGRPLRSSDLRQCPMNYLHPQYRPSLLARFLRFFRYP